MISGPFYFFPKQKEHLSTYNYLKIHQVAITQMEYCFEDLRKYSEIFG